MELSNVNLLDLQTKYMQKDKTTKAMSSALTEQFIKTAAEANNCLIWTNIDNLSEQVLDQLALELHIEWYDANASLEIKRNLIKNSDKVHMYLGTPYALEQVIDDYFGDGEVEEWFDYGGQPFFFRVLTSNAAVTTDLAKQFTKAIETVKNKRSRLEQIIVLLSGELSLYLAAVVQTGDNYTIEQVV